MVDIARNHRSADITVVPTAGPRTATVPLPFAGPQSGGAAGRIAPAGTTFGGSRDPMRQPVAESGTRSAAAVRYLLAGVRLALGWVFLWAFLDKMFGLGFATTSVKSWVNGGSPTNGFLASAKGPFSGFYHSIAGTAPADVLFMAALLGVGVALLLGIGMRIAAASGALLTVMMWSAVLPPSSNPFMDDHLVYATVLIVLALLGAGSTLGLGRVWAATPLVQRAPWLK